MKIEEMPIELTEIGEESRAELHALLDIAINEMVAEKRFVGEAHSRLRGKSLSFNGELVTMDGLTADVDMELVLTPRHNGNPMRIKGLYEIACGGVQ